MKPCWLVVIKPDSWDVKNEVTSDSNNFPNADKIAIRLKFSISFLDPDLKIGTINDGFHLTGKTLLDREMLNMWKRGTTKFDAHRFRKTGGILSGPLPFLLIILYNFFYISFTLKTLSLNYFQLPFFQNYVYVDRQLAVI